MQKGNLLKINLLPSKFLAAQIEYKKFRKIQWICIIIILFLAFLASLTVALRVFQAQKVNAAQSQLEEFTTKVSAFKETEAQLLILKNRIGTIQKLTAKPSLQREMYNLINQLIPSQLTINSMSVDNSGNVNISLIVPDIMSLQTLVDNLLSPEKNEGRIKRLELAGLTRSREGLFRASIKVIAN